MYRITDPERSRAFHEALGLTFSRQVVVSSSTRSFIAGDLTALREHRLKDFAEPVALFQLGEGCFPPLAMSAKTARTSGLLRMHRRRWARTRLSLRGMRQGDDGGGDRGACRDLP
jgi:hypothetical protein